METVKYVDSFGFTEEEVFAALEEYDLPDQKQQVKDRSGIFETRAMSTYLRPEIITPRLWAYQYSMVSEHLGHGGFSCARSSHA